nr:hypothetical protein Iba_chr13eCG8740 [Ipomoea batatas]
MASPRREALSILDTFGTTALKHRTFGSTSPSSASLLLHGSMAPLAHLPASSPAFLAVSRPVPWLPRPGCRPPSPLMPRDRNDQKNPQFPWRISPFQSPFQSQKRAFLLLPLSPKFKISPASGLQELDEFPFPFPFLRLLLLPPSNPNSEKFNSRVFTDSLTSTPEDDVGSVSQSADGSFSGGAAHETEPEIEPISGLLKLNKTLTLFIKSKLWRINSVDPSSTTPFEDGIQTMVRSPKVCAWRARSQGDDESLSCPAIHIGLELQNA